MDDIYTPNKFLESIETLELCRDYIESPSNVRTRLALILLDNFTEVLMYHKCRDLFKNDEFLRNLMPPRFTQKERNKANDHFKERVSLLSNKARILSAHDATVLRIAHDYRNRAFHHDTHNPKATQAIVSVLFKTACDVLVKVHKHRKGSLWLESQVSINIPKYGIKDAYLPLSKTAQKVSVHLLKRVKYKLEDVRPILIDDLKQRWEQLIIKTLSEIPVPELVLDEILKSEEFDELFDYENASTELREFTYEHITKRKASIKPSKELRERYWRIEREFTQKVRQAYDRFRPNLTWRICCNLRSRINRLPESPTNDRILLSYNQIDETLSKCERLYYSAIRKNEEAQDMEEEIARGK